MYPKGYDPNKFVSVSGDRYIPIFEGVKGDGDFIELVNVGVRDLKEFHNRDAESCDVNNIVKRFQNGDITALQKVQGSYVDLVGAPKDLRSMNEMITNLIECYEGFGTDIKAVYPTFNDWLGSVGSPAWFNVMFPKENNNETENSGDSASGA